MNVRIMKNNPAFLERDELIRGFVVRHADLQLLTERLHEQSDGPCQHILVIGPRGMGKTTLVLRVVADVQLNPTLAKKWYPLVFSEESYEVATAAQLWLEAVGHLARQTGDKRWTAAYLDLRAERDERRLYEKALGRLMDFADEQGKKLLLVVENLNMILGEQLTADDGWTLRHTLQNEPRIMLLATATSRFDEIDNDDKAMYDLFWTFHLIPLNTDECRIVWRTLTGHELAGDRIRPVDILTGGSPRLLSILASFAAGMSLRELMGNLAHLVDEHTSYFKSNIESLPVAERKVYVTLADLWSPATAREVADAGRIDVNKASALLHRLMQRGAVGEVRKEGRTIWYQVTERLYNIYHLMRKHVGGENRVHWFVEFMIGLYEQEAIVDVVRTIADEACDTEPDARRDHFFVYSGILKRLGDDPRVFKIFAATNPRFFQIEDAPEFIKEFPKKVAESISTSLERRADVEMQRLLQMAVEHVEGHRWAEAEATARRMVELDPKRWSAYFILTLVMAAHGRHDETETFLTSLQATAPQDAPWEFMAAVVARKAGQFEKARGAYERALEKAPDFEPMWLEYGSFCEEREDWHAAETAYQRATTLNESNADAWSRLLRVQLHLGKLADVKTSARQALRHHPNDVAIWMRLALSLIGQDQFTDECEDALQHAVSQEVGWNGVVFNALDLFHAQGIQSELAAQAVAERYARLENGRPLFLASLALRVCRGGWTSLFPQAESWARAAVENEPSAGYYRMTLAMILAANGQWTEALREAKLALADAHVLLFMQPLVTVFFYAAAALGHVAGALAVLSASPAAAKLEPLVVALQILDGQTPNAPHEVLEVAKDIVKKIETHRASTAPATTPAKKKTTAKKPKSRQ